MLVSKGGESGCLWVRTALKTPVKANNCFLEAAIVAEDRIGKKRDFGNSLDCVQGCKICARFKKRKGNMDALGPEI